MRLICALLLLLCAGLLRAAPSRVAVLDFDVDPNADGSASWDWAKCGMADLIQIQLQQQGLELVDRDWIHAVLKEQRLAQSGITAPDQLKVATLLNAAYLVTGRVSVRDRNRFRVEANVFSVEEIESVGAVTGEGAVPGDIPVVVEAVAGQIVSALRNRVVFNPPERRTKVVPKPESLIMFYRGLDAAVRSRPAEAAVYFMNAAALDAQFTVPLLWEIRAYEMAGLAGHAAVRREEIADFLGAVEPGGATRSIEFERDARRVIAVLTPVVNGDTTYINSSIVSGELTRAALRYDGIRVFAPEGISAAVAEQDLKLSALFDAQYAPRYDRWLVADGLLLCRAEVSGTNRVHVDLSVADPFTASTVSSAEREGSTSQIHSLLSSAADELLREWMNSGAPGAGSLVGGSSTDDALSPGVAELRPAYRNLEKALVRVQREPNDRETHQALADAFAAAERPRLAAIEIERCIQLLDIHAPHADKTFLGVHRWLFWSADPARGAVGFVDPKVIDQLIGQLLTTYPDSYAAGILRYNLAVSSWRAGNWTNAAAQAATARQSIRPPAENADTDHQVFAATFFLEGDSLAQMGRTNEAKAVFEKGLEYMTRFDVRDFCLPYGPWLDDIFGTEKVYGFGGDPPGIRTRINQKLAALDGSGAQPTQPLAAQKEVADTPADSSASLWIQRADAELKAGRYTGAIEAYRSALDAGASLSQCRGLRTALAELALERNPDNAVSEAERCRVEFHLPPEVVTWVEWFAAGQKYRTTQPRGFEKAAAAYEATMTFLEDPERGGIFQLEPQRGSDRIALIWDRGALGFDLHWSEYYGARWNNAAYQLAQCLIALNRREEAAQWLRRVALNVGGDNMPLYDKAGWDYASYTTVKLGVLAAEQLKQLHISDAQAALPSAAAREE